MRHQTWEWLINWTGRMAQKYGGTVWEKSGKWWDWGQAICREMYGLHWNESEGFKIVSNQDDSAPVPLEVIKRAEEWEKGEWPNWVDKELIGIDNYSAKFIPK